ncbi:MAG: glycosyltransferase, partial [Elusimicrobia bacterium]|nr:glycosyltransferase [Elusimicrobiota bacterium]
MNIAILNLTGGGISGGYKKYLVRLLPLLEPRLDGGRILCAAPANIPIKDWFGGLARTEFTACKPFSPLPGRDTALLEKLKDFSPDLVFVPLERYFRYPGVPFVSMLVNMAPMLKNYADGSVAEKARQLVQLYHARRSARKATHIIVTSKFVRSFLVSSWGLPEEKISVIYPGADSAEGLALVKPTALAEKGWNKFFWTIGSLEKYRGLEDILAALQLPGAQDHKLVICASVRRQMAAYAGKLKAGIAAKGLADRILWVSGLSEGELAWCYKNAAAYIMTSRIEAGPNTALEAMSFGAVSIAAQNPPLPEFFAETALYYPPGDGKALAARMAEAEAWG